MDSGVDNLAFPEDAWNDEMCTNTSIPFNDLPSGCCRATDVHPFSYDLQLFGFECNDNGGWFVGFLFIIIALKIGQSYLYTNMGKKQREIMQMERNKDCGSRCCSKRGQKIWWLMVLEFISGVAGILSIIIITGANAIIWALIVVTNCVGVFISFSLTSPDHHSLGTDISNMVEKVFKKPKNEDEKCENGVVEDAILDFYLALEALQQDPCFRERVNERKQKLCGGYGKTILAVAVPCEKETLIEPQLKWF